MIPHLAQENSKHRFHNHVLRSNLIVRSGAPVQHARDRDCSLLLHYFQASAKRPSDSHRLYLTKSQSRHLRTSRKPRRPSMPHRQTRSHSLIVIQMEHENAIEAAFPLLTPKNPPRSRTALHSLIRKRVEVEVQCSGIALRLIAIQPATFRVRKRVKS